MLSGCRHYAWGQSLRPCLGVSEASGTYIILSRNDYCNAVYYTYVLSL